MPLPPGERKLVSNGNLPSPLYARTDQLVDAQEAFVIVISNETTITVEIAEPAVIVATYAIMFVPLGVGWASMLYFGTQAKHYMILLPLTYVAMTIALDLVNQSLSALMGAPMSITAIQALCLAMIAGTWALAKELVHPYMCLEVLLSLRGWTVVAVLFSAYQLINHLVSLYCSLSERTVFYGITPVAMVATELLFLPTNIKTHASFNSKLAMGGMLVGAGLFAVQYPDFTTLGVLSATGMIASQVPYRLFQRWNLAGCMVAPLAVLACYDGLFLFAPAFVLADVSLDAFWSSWEGWLADPSVALLLLLSSLVLTFHHILGLALLRVTSATATMIFYCIANILILILGIFFFGDNVFGVFTFTGIVLTLVCGLWYAADLCMAFELPAKGAAESALRQEKAETHDARALASLAAPPAGMRDGKLPDSRTPSAGPGG